MPPHLPFVRSWGRVPYIVNMSCFKAALHDNALSRAKHSNAHANANGSRAVISFELLFTCLVAASTLSQVGGSTGQYEITGSGTDIRGAADQFHAWASLAHRAMLAMHDGTVGARRGSRHGLMRS
jgi:hypothetical protein